LMTPANSVLGESTDEPAEQDERIIGEPDVGAPDVGEPDRGQDGAAP
jgi:hypothetical protein